MLPLWSPPMKKWFTPTTVRDSEYSEVQHAILLRTHTIFVSRRLQWTDSPMDSKLTFTKYSSTAGQDIDVLPAKPAAIVHPVRRSCASPDARVTAPSAVKQNKSQNDVFRLASKSINKHRNRPSFSSSGITRIESIIPLCTFLVCKDPFCVCRWNDLRTSPFPCKINEREEDPYSLRSSVPAAQYSVRKPCEKDTRVVVAQGHDWSTYCHLLKQHWPATYKPTKC